MSYGLSVVLAVFFAVGLAMVGMGGRSMLRARAARDWPTVPGKITSCDLEEDRDSEDGTTWSVKASYTYRIGNQTYVGDKVAFGYQASGTRKDHVAIYEKLQHCDGVAVRYNPRDPSEAVLAWGMNKSIAGVLIFGVMWLIFVTGFAGLMMLQRVEDTGMLRSIQANSPRSK